VNWALRLINRQQVICGQDKKRHLNGIENETKQQYGLISTPGSCPCSFSKDNVLAYTQQIYQ